MRNISNEDQYKKVLNEKGEVLLNEANKLYQDITNLINKRNKLLEELNHIVHLIDDSEKFKSVNKDRFTLIHRSTEKADQKYTETIKAAFKEKRIPLVISQILEYLEENISKLPGKNKRAYLTSFLNRNHTFERLSSKVPGTYILRKWRTTEENIELDIPLKKYIKAYVALKKMTSNKRWTKGLDSLKNFQKNKDETYPPIEYIDENNFFLGRWYRRQEIEYNRDKLQDKKTDELLKLNIDLKSKFKKMIQNE